MNLTQKQKEIIWEYVNPPGNNTKNVNFYRIVGGSGEYTYIEIGYWITYIGCRPKYSKERISVPKSLLNPSK